MSNTRLKKIWDILGSVEYSSLSTNNDRMEKVNKKDKIAYNELDSSELLAWSAVNGRFMKFKKATTNTALSDDRRAIAEVCLLLVSRDTTSLDLNDPTRVLLVNAALAYGFINSEDVAALYAMAQYSVSHAEQEGVGLVRLGDIEKASMLFGRGK